MGLLDYADEARNKLVGLLGEMPISRMMRDGVQMPTVNGLRDALYAMPKPFNADDQTANELAMALWNPAGLLGKIVYHGSPHKFNKFDASKIGTGEGAQAYGHGVYLADSEKVAKGYKSKLEAGFGAEPDDVMARVLNTFDGDAKRTAQEFRTRAERANIPGGKERLLAWADKIESGYDPRGALYKADLPDEWIPKMLDWDKPLSQQPESVRVAVQDFGLPANATGKQVYDALANHSRDMAIIRGKNSATGLTASQSAAADSLREFGIPGIRYLDGGSRPNGGRISMLEQTIANLKGKGASQAAIANTQRELDAELARASYNYVVFPGLEDQVKILERNGKGLLDF